VNRNRNGRPKFEVQNRGAFMPNGDDKNWFRICSVVDEFRTRHGHWPTSVRLPPAYFENVVGHVLSPIGFALVSSALAIFSDDEILADVPIIAEGGCGDSIRCGDGPSSAERPEPTTMDYFGHAIFRPGLQ